LRGVCGGKRIPKRGRGKKRVGGKKTGGGIVMREERYRIRA